MLEPAEPSRLPLTARELQVLGLIARHRTNREIAELLTISDQTVHVHVAHILRKLGVKNRRDAAEIFDTIKRRRDSA